MDSIYGWAKAGLVLSIPAMGIKTPVTEPLVTNNRPNGSPRSLRAQFEHASRHH